MTSHAPAVRHLKRVDPKLARIIEEVGPCRLVVRREGTHFEAVARAIVYQQLSGAAASTIWGRVTTLHAGALDAGRVLATEDADWRAAGVSRQKLGYLRSLALQVRDHGLPIERLHEQDDATVIEELTRIKGIGRWTAQIFLLFRLGRPDVLPELDLGIRKAIRQGWRLRTMPDTERVLRIGTPWSPYRSVASWYLWRWLDGPAE